MQAWAAPGAASVPRSAADRLRPALHHSSRQPCLRLVPARGRTRLLVRAAGTGNEEGGRPLSKNAKILTLFTASAMEFALTGVAVLPAGRVGWTGQTRLRLRQFNRK